MESVVVGVVEVVSVSGKNGRPGRLARVSGVGGRERERARDDDEKPSKRRKKEERHETESGRRVWEAFGVVGGYARARLDNDASGRPLFKREDRCSGKETRGPRAEDILDEDGGIHASRDSEPDRNDSPQDATEIPTSEIVVTRFIGGLVAQVEN